MNNLNSILIEGNLTRDPVLATTPKGTPVCNFSVASNRFYRQDTESKKEVSFFDVEVWAKLANQCGEYLSKGRGVRVVGRLKQDRWTDNDGKNHSRVKIVGEHVEFRPNFTGAKPAEEELEDPDVIVEALDESEAMGEQQVEEQEVEAALPF
ncbi:MAG: single-stranded DNA-binding protein [Spirochaetota bacterium]